MNKTKSILFSIIWTVTILIFPISSGIIAVVFELDQIFTFVIQGAFMLVSIIIPLSYIKIKKCSFAEYGFRMIEKNSSKRVYSIGNLQKTKFYMGTPKGESTKTAIS